ncbi:hypothetical protein GCM10020221_03250 [Streptomyces thioluteus]|uniref:Glycoside-hydrolase family GH114 TIM-barrel domain-containing protein n=1 Tax=Streptomyces thioluteus TaxID=66431 RepID=A0ABP6IV64_STRTU
MADRTLRRLGGAAFATAVLLIATAARGRRRHPPTPTTPRWETSSPSAHPRPGGARWQPKPGTRWQWQLDGAVDTSVDVPVYDIDGFENDAATVAKLHAKKRKVICYINAGAYEDWRPDQGKFPESVLGAKNEGWKGEKWLDIRRLDVLRPIMAERFDMCREKGFDAVEPDLTEGFRNKTGFPLTAAHQLAFNRMIASLAHERGMPSASRTTSTRSPSSSATSTSPSTNSARSTASARSSSPSWRRGRPSSMSSTRWRPVSSAARRRNWGSPPCRRAGPERLAQALLTAPRNGT